MESKREVLLQWIKQGSIPIENATKAIEVADVLPAKADWKKFLEKLLVWLGAMSLAFSVMFFIAYNWDAIGRFGRFALIQILIAASLFFYWKHDADTVAARASLMSAGLLVGVLLAFYGQTYQTGADPWQLFANWALLIIPWVIVGRFAAILVLWIALVNISLLLYFDAMGGFFRIVFDSPRPMLWIVFVFNSLAWLAWELAARRYEWLAERWATRLLAIASGMPLTSLMLFSIFNNYDQFFITILVYLAWGAALLRVYRKTIKDLFMLAGLCLTAIVVITSFFAEAMFSHGGGEGAAFFFLAILVIGQASFASLWLKNIQREQLS